MVRHSQSSVRATGQGQAGQMEERAAGPRQTDRRTLEKRAAQDHAGRNDLRMEDGFLAMNVVQKEFEGFQPLTHTGRHLCPLAPTEQRGQQVAKPRMPPPRTVAGNVEGHPHLAHRGFEPLDDQPRLAAREGKDKIKDRTVDFTRCAIRLENLVPEAADTVFPPFLHPGTVSPAG